MGNFNVKNFFGSMFTPVQDEEYEENYYEEETGYADEPEEAYIEEPIVEEPIVEDAAETKTFDSELVNFMNENYPGMNFPSSCPVKNEVIMTNGNRLTLVSLKNLGHKNFWVYIYYSNRDIISNPNNVPIGAKIKIPDLNTTIIDDLY